MEQITETKVLYLKIKMSSILPNELKEQENNLVCPLLLLFNENSN
jgi:hypothetical protein